MPYRSSDAVGRLILDRGRAAADAERRAGEIAAQNVANLGQIAGRTLADVVGYHRDAPRRALEEAETTKRLRGVRDDENIDMAVRSSIDPATGRVDPARAAREVQAIDPQKALAWWQQADEQQKQEVARAKQAAQDVSATAGAILAAPADQRPGLYLRARTEIIGRGLAKPEGLPEAYDEGWLVTKHREALTVAQQIEAAEKAVDQQLARDKENREGISLMETARDREADNTRQAARDAETVRHNQVMERNAAAQANRPDDAADRARKKEAERWKADQLAALGRERRRPAKVDSISGTITEPAMTQDQYRAEVARIDASYRQMLGQAPAAAQTPNADRSRNAVLPPDQRNPDVPGRPARGPVAAPPPAAAPARAGGPAPSRAGGPPAARPAAPTGGAPRVQVGQVVPVGGRSIRITRLYPDGTFDGDEVR